jgi:dephospho-CoA kinase
MDAALLIETGYHKKMDKLIVVYAGQKDQVKRLRERDHFTLEQALARISSQMPLDEKRKYADYVIDNTGTREASEQQTREVFEKLRQEAGKRE